MMCVCVCVCVCVYVYPSIYPSLCVSTYSSMHTYRRRFILHYQETPEKALSSNPSKVTFIDPVPCIFIYIYRERD